MNKQTKKAKDFNHLFYRMMVITDGRVFNVLYSKKLALQKLKRKNELHSYRAGLQLKIRYSAVWPQELNSPWPRFPCLKT